MLPAARALAGALGILLMVLLPTAPVRAAEAPLRVFAAASLKESLDAVVADWMAGGGSPAVVVYGSSGTLARQIAQGAPADLFVSADQAWMDELASAGWLVPGSRVDLLGNSLVVVAPAGSRGDALPPEPAAWLQALGPSGRLAVAETGSVPAGRYAKASLQHLGLWPALAGRLAQGEDVRGALAFVARGEAPLGIVYATDARSEPRVRVRATLPADSHPPITYPAARLRGAAPDTAALLAHLRGPGARAIFEHAGFRVP